jgi:phenylacetate-CoA ligase
MLVNSIAKNHILLVGNLKNLMSYSRLVRNVLYPLDLYRIGEGAELRYLRSFEQSQFLPTEELRNAAFKKLQSLLNHAYIQCPFYYRHWDAARVVPGDVRSLKDLSIIPILEKRHIQLYRDEMVARDWPKTDLIQDRTGGSTGTPISFFYGLERKCSRSAAIWRHNRWAGWDIGDKTAWFWGAARDLPPETLKSRLRNLLIDRKVLLNTAQITEHALFAYNQALKRFRPKVLVAYANSIALFARYLKSKGLAPYQPASIIPTAEVLNPDDRSLLENTFGCPVFNRYGCREVSVIASECAAHTGLHTMCEGLHVEVVCGNRPALPGELGTVLITDLVNFAMPLIRYRIGDMAVLAEGDCPCGRGLPRLARVEGRVTDFLVGSEGQLVSGAALTITLVAKRPMLGQVQIYQEAMGRVLYNIAPSEGIDVAAADLDYLRSETKYYLGKNTEVEFQFVKEIPSETSGKHIFCRSLATCDFLDFPPSNTPVSEKKV